MNAIATMAVGDTVMQAYGRHTLPYIEAYAARIGARLEIINQSWGEQLHPLMNKFQLGGMLCRYERIAYIDLDTLILPHCPDVFDVVASSHLGTVIDFKETEHHPVPAHVTKETQAVNAVLQPNYPLDTYANGYFQGCLLVLSQVHKVLFDSTPAQLQAWQQALNSAGSGFLCEQSLFNHFVRLHKLAVQYLPDTWFLRDPRRVPGFRIETCKSNMVHYGGAYNKQRLPIDAADVARQRTELRGDVASTIGRPMTLSQLFEKYGSRTDKVNTHNYGKMYDDWVGRMRDRGDMTILLLGVNMFGGGDIDAFAEYFPTARIIAVDLSFANVVTTTAFTRVQANAYDKRITWQHNLGQYRFDLIVDDCLHTAEAQIQAFQLYWPLLKNDGCYIVEDIQNHNLNCVAALQRLASPYRCFSYFAVASARADDDAVVVIK